MRTPRQAGRRALALVISCAAVLVAGCGAATPGAQAPAASARPPVSPLAGLTARQILTRAFADLGAASSVHIAGSSRVPGQATVIDLTVGARACKGTIEIGGQGSLLLLRIGSTLWIKADSQLWRSAGSAAAGMGLVEGKYLQLTVTSPAMSSFGMLCDLSELAAQLGGGVGADRVAMGKTTTILGQPALQLTDGQQDIAYVTISARPEFLRLGGKGGYLDFTDYDAPVTVTRPPAGETIDGAGYGV